jgi:hypothetical protein
MKAIVVATVMTIVLLVLVTLAFRIFPTPWRARQMTLIYFGCLFVSAVAWLTTPADLGFFPGPLLIEPQWLDFFLMLFFFAAAFFGGVLQLYNLADRGFSLRILIDIDNRHTRFIDADWLVTNYGGGRGLTWMYGKRIEGLLETKFVCLNAEVIELTPKGKRIADVFLAVRGFLRLESQP